MKLMLSIFVLIVMSAHGWEKFFDAYGNQQRVSCDSDRVSMNYFNDPIIDGVEYYPQTHYETRDGTLVTQYVALVKQWDKKREYYSIEVHTLKRYSEYRKNDADGKGYLAQFNLVLSSFNSGGDIFRSSYTVRYKSKGFWSKKTIRRMENK